MKTGTYVTAVFMLLLARNVFGDNDLLPGSVGNVGSKCGRPGPIRVQFLGANASPMVEVPEGAYVPVSLLRGMYGVTVMSEDGQIVEETKALIMDSNYHLNFGCVPPISSDAVSGPMEDVYIVNTSGTCGTSHEVEFFFDGRSVGTVPDGSEKKVRAPAGGVLVDVLNAQKRLLTLHVPRLAKGQSIVYGCTDPDAVSPSASGVSVAFHNTTDACEKPEERRFITLWIDGLPKLGLPPGGKGIVKVNRGIHEFYVTIGATRETVMRGQKDVKEPFRIRWGCGK